MDGVSAWADRKLITFGLDKCGVVSLEPQERILQGQPLPQRSVYKYLRIHLGAPVQSDNLDSLQDGFQLSPTWQALKAELERLLFWHRMLRGSSLAVRRVAYLVLVRSKMAYGLELIVRDYNDELQAFQDKELRVVAQIFSGVSSTKLHELFDLPTVHELALQRAGSIYASLVDHPSPVGAAFDRCIEEDEGAQNLYSLFGLVQDALPSRTDQIPLHRLAPIASHPTPRRRRKSPADGATPYYCLPTPLAPH